MSTGRDDDHGPGAGCSTESGIPDYRSPGARPRRPVQYQDFLRSAQARAHYWARSTLGWPRFRGALPNPAHRALAALHTKGHLAGLLTQNVDGLHQLAGHPDVVDLHGSLAHVVCLGCRARTDRDALQARLVVLNPGWLERGAGSSTTTPAGPPEHAPDSAPDGDVEVETPEDFVVPPCEACGDVLKPDVVFFGENVPVPRVERGWTLLDEADALLVVGSSLTVYSGYRFPRRAHEMGRPVGILNQGPTRGDPLASLRIEARAGAVRTSVVGLLG